MKKVISFFAVAVVFAFTGTVMASPPVCPPFEGFLIETETDIVVHGLASETESFDWKWNDAACNTVAVAVPNGIAPNGHDQIVPANMNNIIGPNGINDPDTLGPLENVGRITYEEEFDSFNGLAQTIDATTYHKKFTANSHPDDTANLVVEKDIGYTSDGEAGSHADLEEIASEEVVSAGGAFGWERMGPGALLPGNFGGGSMFTGVLSLCPWAFNSGTANGANGLTYGPGIYPATNEGIAMGSTFAIPAQLANGDPGNISFSSDTEVGVTKGVWMNYNVDANGKGLIKAEMIARLWEGSDMVWRAPATTAVNNHLLTDGTTPSLNSVATYTETSMTNGIFDPPPLNSVATYQEYVKADGIFQFHKGMTYRAQFAAPSITPIDLEILAP